MWRYIVKRLLQATPLLLGIATVTFVIVHLAPGDRHGGEQRGGCEAGRHRP